MIAATGDQIKTGRRRAEKVGEDLAIDWPAGIGAKGNDAVSADVARTVGGIGYVEYAYAKHNNLSCARMINRAGKSVAPTLVAFQAYKHGSNVATQFGYVPMPESGVASIRKMLGREDQNRRRAAVQTLAAWRSHRKGGSRR